MIELLVAAAIVCVALAAISLTAERERQKAKGLDEFAAANSLRVMALDHLQGDDVDVSFAVRSNGDGRQVTRVTFVGQNVPRDVALGTEGLLASNDWQLGDLAFDRAVKLRGERGYLAYALGEEQRALILSLLVPWDHTTLELADGTLTLSRAWHESEGAARLLHTGRKLAAHFFAPLGDRVEALVARATTDPLVDVRAAAVEALNASFADAFAAVLPALRRDAAPQVRLAVALATRDEHDVRAVPLAKVSDAQRRQLWDRCARVFGPQQVRRLVALCEEEVHAARYAKAILVTDATPLLANRFEAVRLEAVRWLAHHGGVADVPALRALEKSSLSARKQVEACRAAIAAIQKRAGVVEAAGAVSLGQDLAGAISDSEDEA